MKRWAFEISERLGLPCIVRGFTRISHSRGNVKLGEQVDKGRVLKAIDQGVTALAVNVPMVGALAGSGMVHNRNKAIRQFDRSLCLPRT